MNEFKPNWILPFNQVLEDYLEFFGVSEKYFFKNFNILKDQNEETLFLGKPIRFWKNLQKQCSK